MLTGEREILEYLKNILVSKKKQRPNLKYKRVKSSNSNFLKNFEKGKINIIAEIKNASPSKGVLNHFEVKKIASAYNKFQCFIKGISVLTEPLYFKGSIDNIKKVKEVTDIPILRKDFIIYPEQVYESANHGADCILLIASLMSKKKLKALYNLAKELGLDVMVEAHNLDEFQKALDMGANIIGINNRNLKDLQIEKENSVNIIDKVENSKLQDVNIICESGIEHTKHILEMQRQGICNFLIGTYFMRAKSVITTLSYLELALNKEGLI